MPIEDCLLTRPKHVALVALGPSMHEFTKAQMAQERDFPEFDEVWTLNAGITWLRADKIFDMHDLNKNDKLYPRYSRHMHTSQVPIITLKKYPEFPCSVAYPFKEVVEF